MQMDAVKRTMKIRAFAIAGALAVVSTAFPKSAESKTYEFWYGYTAGALAALCDLHMNGIISSSTVKEATQNFLSTKDPDIPAAATTNAVKALKEVDEFKNCPIKHP